MNMTLLTQKILSTALAAAITVSVSSASLKKTTNADHYVSAAAKTVEDQLNCTMSRTVTIKVTPANVRSGAGKSYAVIGTAAKGKSYQYLDTKKDAKGKSWYKIQYTPDQTGWLLVSLGNVTDEINSSLFTATTATTTTTTTTTATTTTATTTTTVSSTAKTTAASKNPVTSSSTSTEKSRSITSSTSASNTSSNPLGTLNSSVNQQSTTLPTSSDATTTTTQAAGTSKNVIISGNPVNVRSGAGGTFPKIGATSKGKKFRLISTQNDSSGKKWYQIQFTSTTTGWVLASLAYIEGEGKNAANKNTGKVAYLTFDDGPSENTVKILDILDKYDVKATFFVIYHRGMKSRYQEIVNRGHTIALHSYTHTYSKIYKSEEDYFKDLNQIHDYVEDVTGVDSHIIRFPGGSSNTVSNKYNRGIMKKLKESVTEKGFVYHDWNVDSTDAKGKNRKASLLLQNVKSGVGKKKTIDVLMHDTGKSKVTTVEALPSIIEYLSDQGFSFEALTEETEPIQHKR